MALGQVIPSPLLECPYVGLHPYTAAERDYFFGRKRDQEVIFSNLFSARLTILYGASGVGKSSVLQAGLLPMLEGRRRALAVYFREWQSPIFLHDLKVECLRVVRQAHSKPFLASPELRLDEMLAAIAEASHRTVYVILDQFEDLFLYHPESATTFDSELASSINRDDVNANFLIAVRDDAVSKLDRFRTRIADLLGNTLRIRHLDLASAEEAIRGPLAVYNQRIADPELKISVEDELIQSVLAQLRPSSRAVPGAAVAEDADRIETPFLQLVLERLWREELQQNSRTMRLKTLVELGNADRIVRTHFDNVMTAFSENERTLCADIFRFLVTPDRSKVAVSASALSQLTGVSEAEINRVMEKLCHGASRVLRAVAAPEGGCRYEIFHDVLAPAILDWRTRRVQEQQRIEAEQQAVLDTAKQVQEERRKAEEAAERERERNVARELALRQAEQLAEEQRSRAEENARAARRLRRLATALAVGGGLLLVLAVTAGVFWRQAHQAAREARSALQGAQIAANRELVARGEAETQKGIAVQAATVADLAKAEAEGKTIIARQAEEKASQLAVINAANKALESDPELGILLAIGAVSGSAPADKRVVNETMAVLHRGLEASHILRTISLDSSASSVVFSPDGQRIATAHSDGTTRIWDPNSGRQLHVLYGHVGTVNAVAFSPSGALLATAGSDGKAKVWEADSGREVLTLTGHLAPLTDISFAGGNLLATASEDGTVRLWSVRDGEARRILSGHWGKVEALGFDADGKRLATAGSDKRLIIWDIASGQILRDISIPAKPTSVAFEYNGNRIAVSDVEGNVTFWDARYGRKLKVVPASSTSIFHVALSQDGKQFATAAYDGTVRVRDAETGRPLYALAGHKAAADYVAFSPDQKEVATTGWDETLRLWSTAARDYQDAIGSPGDPTKVHDFAYSADGRFLAVARSDQTVQIWDVASGKALRSITLPRGDTPFSVAFSPDSKKIASAGTEGSAAIWDFTSGKRLCSMVGHAKEISRIAFSPDGKLVATASSDATAGIWDANSCQRFRVLPHKSEVFAAVFSADGRYVATASNDKTAKLWNASSGLELATFKKHWLAVLDVAFSPRGDRLVTASSDKTARVWDISGKISGEPVATLRGHSDSVMTVAYSPDGTQIVTGSLDKTVKLWDANSGKELQTISKGIQKIETAKFSPDGRWLAVRGDDPLVRIYALKMEDLRRLTRSRINRRLTNQECVENLGQPCPDEAALLVEQARKLCSDFTVSVIRSAGEAMGAIRVASPTLKQAREKFRRAKLLDPTLSFNPDTESQRVAAELSLLSAKVIVESAGKEEAFIKARDLVRLAVALDSTIPVDADEYFGRLVANRLLVEARSAAQNGDLNEATADLQGVAKWDKTLDLIPDRDARTMVAQGKFSKALELFGGDQPSAMSELEKAVEVAPDYAVAHKLLASEYAVSKEYDKAIRHLELAARVTPEPDTLFQIAELHQKLADHGPAKNAQESQTALALAEASFQRYPGYRCGYVSLGRIQFWREEYEKALQSLRKIDDTDFCYEDAMVVISAIYFDKQHDYERAYEIYKQARAQNPDYVGHLANLAEASLATKRYDNASDLAHQAMQQMQRSGDNDISVALAMRFIVVAALTLRGQKDLADQELRDFVDFYNQKVTSEFEQEWTFIGSENFIRHEESITAPQRDLLLKLLAVLQTPQASIRIQDFQ